MINIQVNFFSHVLATRTQLQILYPTMPDRDNYLVKDMNDIYVSKDVPVLYLLHGALEDENGWMRHTLVEDYAEEHGFAIVMVRGENGFYSDMKVGKNFETYIVEELPKFLHSFLHISTKTEDTYIAGPSMGGYGASMIALKHPDRYMAFADMSGALDPASLKPRMEAMGMDFFDYDAIFGGVDKVQGSEHDVFTLLKNASGQKPIVYIYCGLRDTANLDMNRRFYKECLDNGYEAYYSESQGEHNWAYWNQSIKDFLDKILTVHQKFS